MATVMASLCEAEAADLWRPKSEMPLLGLGSDHASGMIFKASVSSTSIKEDQESKINNSQLSIVPLSNARAKLLRTLWDTRHHAMNSLSPALVAPGEETLVANVTSSLSRRLIGNGTSYRSLVRINSSFPLKSMQISLAFSGTALVVTWPPGQPTQIPVGGSGDPSTWTALSCDQYPEPA